MKVDGSIIEQHQLVKPLHLEESNHLTQRHTDMSEDPAYLRNVSLHLSRTLDEIGLNTLTVKRRRQTFSYMEQLHNVYWLFTGLDISVYHFGSQTEGATTPGLKSDLDTLIYFHDSNVIQDWPEWKQDKDNLLMLQEDTAPGYCRLQQLRHDIPMAREDLPNEHYTYDSRGRVMLKNTWLNAPIEGDNFDRNGPARSQSSGPGLTDNDFVSAIRCSSWPGQATEFTRRHRLHGWPSPRLLQQAVKHGVFLVPVGYKLSPTEHLEWRISASLAERYLMFSLSIVHIKCYVVLKMLVKTFVEPRVRKCISSYHCKTALLYCTENTEPGFWRDDNLLQCVIQCLMKLLAWVTDGFCPQFIISEENLFARKVTARNRGILQSIFTDLIKSNCRSLLRVHIDGLSFKLQAKLNTEPSTVPIRDSVATVKLIGWLEYERHRTIHESQKELMVQDKSTNSVTVIKSIHQMIRMLKDRIEPSGKQQRQAVQAFIEFLSCWLGSLLASVSLSHKMAVPRKAIHLFRKGAKFDIASMLKLASIFYCTGDLHKGETILQNIEDHFHRNEIQVVCNCYVSPTRPPLEFCHMMYVLRGKKARAKLFARCVRFSPQEIHSAPSALRNELYRAVGDDIQQRDPRKDEWMVLAAVDCLPYLYYLQYITYRQLGKHDLRKRSLHNLDRCIREDNGFRHLETAWNLLGQCMELEQEPETAMACYKTSLEIRPRNNAANWHVQNLCYTWIRNGCLPM